MMIRGFHILSQAWYADANLRGKFPAKFLDDVTFGMFDEDNDGGTTGEMSLKWYELGGKVVPKLECFSDARPVRFGQHAALHQCVFDVAQLIVVRALGSHVGECQRCS